MLGLPDRGGRNVLPDGQAIERTHQLHPAPAQQIAQQVPFPPRPGEGRVGLYEAIAVSVNRHQVSFLLYQSTVSRIPSANLYSGSQPSGLIRRVSIAYDQDGRSFVRRFSEDGLPPRWRIASARWLAPACAPG